MERKGREPKKLPLNGSVPFLKCSNREKTPLNGMAMGQNI